MTEYTLNGHKMRFFNKRQWAVAVSKTANCQLLLPTLISKLSPIVAHHTPVLLHESIDGLKINPEGVYVDLTFGSGGHSQEIFKKLKGGKLIAFDHDEETKQNSINDKRFVFVHGNFRFFKNFLLYLGFKKVHGVLADLGVSSHHFDKKERGFSFRSDGLLDMRMNKSAKLTAAYLVNNLTPEKLSKLFFEFGEIRNANQVAQLIVKTRNVKPIETTFDLCKALSQVTPKVNEHKFLAKVFQALRIEVNAEIEALKEMLTLTPEMILPGGRLVIITYHSLEDRLVKNFMRSGNFEGKVESDVFGNIHGVPFKVVNNKVIVPNENEINNNSRARSAKLRIAERND